MPGDALTAAVGWHGKLPCRGDFVTGGAPLTLIEGWRRWALAGLPAVRAGGVPARDAFLTAPPIRFAAAPGVFGPAQGVGLFGPGCDAAGRLFPFVVAAETGVADPDAALAAAAGWLDAVAAAYSAALAPAFDPATFSPLPFPRSAADDGVVRPASAPPRLAMSAGSPPAAPAAPAPGGRAAPGAVFAADPAPARRLAAGAAADATLFAALFRLPAEAQA